MAMTTGLNWPPALPQMLRSIFVWFGMSESEQGDLLIVGHPTPKSSLIEYLPCCTTSSVARLIYSFQVPLREVEK